MAKSMFVMDVHHEKDEPFAIVQLDGNPLACIPVYLTGYPLDQTANDWVQAHGSHDVTRCLIRKVLSMAMDGSFIYPQEAPISSPHHRGFYQTSSEASFLEYVEKVYYHAVETDNKTLVAHLDTVLAPESRAFVEFSTEEGETFKVSLREFEEWVLSYCWGDIELKPFQQILRPAFMEARDYLVEDFCEALPDWFDLTDDESVHANEAAFGKAIENFMRDPRGFWDAYGITDLELTMVHGMGPVETTVSGVKVAILIEGGLVQQVYCNGPADVMVFDRDTEGADEDEIADPEDVRALLERISWRPVGCDRYLVEAPLAVETLTEEAQ